MRKLYSGFFLLLMLLSTFGYWQLLTLVEQQYFNEARERIAGKGGEIMGNMLLRLPLEGPYGGDDDTYISVQGEVVVEGQLYHLVKKKVYRDTLYIVCLGDEATTMARKAVADYAQTFSDQSPDSKPASAKKPAGSFSIDYILSGLAAHEEGPAVQVTLFHETPESLYRYRSIVSIFRPPCRSLPFHG